MRVPLAGGTLVPVPGSGHSDEILRSLLALSDVMSTGHHAAVMRRRQGGATRSRSSATAPSACAPCWPPSGSAPSAIIALSRHPARQKVAREFGATDIVEARGDEAVAGGARPDRRHRRRRRARVRRHRAVDRHRRGDRPARLDHRHRRRAARRGAVHRDVLPQHRLARRPRPGPGLHPRAARRRPRRHASTPASSSTTRPTSTTSPTPTRRWTSGGPSSRWSGWSDLMAETKRARSEAGPDAQLRRMSG